MAEEHTHAWLQCIVLLAWKQCSTCYHCFDRGAHLYGAHFYAAQVLFVDGQRICVLSNVVKGATSR